MRIYFSPHKSEKSVSPTCAPNVPFPPERAPGGPSESATGTPELSGKRTAIRVLWHHTQPSGVGNSQKNRRGFVGTIHVLNAAQQNLPLLLEAQGTPGWVCEAGSPQELWVKHPAPRLGDRAVTALGTCCRHHTVPAAVRSPDSRIESLHSA